jgi:hypothetical protein
MPVLYLAKHFWRGQELAFAAEFRIYGEGYIFYYVVKVFKDFLSSTLCKNKLECY